MSLYSRSLCSRKYIIRAFIAAIIICSTLLIYRPFVVKNDYCNTAYECHQLLKQKTDHMRHVIGTNILGSTKEKPYDIQQLRQQNLHNQDNGSKSQFWNFSSRLFSKNPLAVTTEIDNTSSSSKSSSSNSQQLSVAELEYKKITDTSLPRVKAAFVVLVRNSELYALRSSMRYLEDRFNHKYNYPWIFLNDEPFTEEFKDLTRSMTAADVQYGLVPKEHWSYPPWIDQDLAAKRRQEMASRNIVYGGSESYRHMCRYQSGFFMLHPLLDGLDYYWRVEPGVKFSCDIDYDPFRLMQERDLKYGFTIALREFRATIPTLWRTTLDFAKANPQYIYSHNNSDSLYRFITDDKGWTYNLCHFWSNFEIASLKFMRSEAYQAYFKYLDETGGFFYERWGDAPVHSIAASLMLKQSDVHWFYDIGYKHDHFEHCPTEQKWLTNSKCYCDPSTTFDFNGGSCSNLFLDVVNRTASSYIVTRPDEES